MKNVFLGAGGLVLSAALVWFALNEFEPTKLVIENQDRSITILPGQESVKVIFEVSSNRQVELTHVETNCECAIVSDLPVILEAGVKKTITAEIDLKKSKVPATRQFLFYTIPPVDRPLSTVKLLSSDTDAIEGNPEYSDKDRS